MSTGGASTGSARSAVGWAPAARRAGPPRRRIRLNLEGGALISRPLSSCPGCSRRASRDRYGQRYRRHNRCCRAAAEASGWTAAWSGDGCMVKGWPLGCPGAIPAGLGRPKASRIVTAMREEVVPLQSGWLHGMQSAKGGDRVPELRLALLGPPRVERDGSPMEVDTRKAVALLAYLAVTGGWQGRDGIAGLLWPDYDRAHARAALRRTLSTLNKALGGGWLGIERSALRLDADDAWFDVRQFHDLVAGCLEHGHGAAEVCAACVAPLAAAVALHRGEFLAGFSLRDSPSFDDWQSFQADSLRRELAGALDRLTRGLSGTGHWEEAVAAARRWLALDTLHEPAHQRLMRLCACSGQRSAALRQYRECVRVLDDELGVAPLEATTALYQEILENRVAPPAPLAAAATSAAAPEGTAGQAPTSLWTGPAAPSTGAAAAAPEGQGGGQPVPAGGGLPLVGRSAEWAALLAAHARAAPDGHLVVIEGEAGIGKTRLAEDFLAAARARGAVTLAGRCYEEEAGLAYGPFVDMLRAAAGSPDRAGGPGRWADHVAGHWLAEAARLVPELAEDRPDLPPTPSPGSPGAQGRFLEGVTQVLLRAVAGATPGVVLLDDLHWVDEASLDVLTYVVRRLSGRPVCIVATWRGEQVPRSHRLRRLVAEAGRAGAATVLHLARLTEAEVAELVRAAAPASAGQSRDLWRETEGLPFFLVEYLAVLASRAAGSAAPEALPASGGAAEESPASGASGDVAAGPVPGGVRELVRSRLAAVSGTGWQVLTTAAVIGRSFDLETLREASGRGDDETVAALEELTARGLVGEVAAARAPLLGGQVVYDFGHERVRAIVYEETSLARRRLLHRRVAEALAGRSRGPQRGAAAALVAHHPRPGAAGPGRPPRSRRPAPTPAPCTPTRRRSGTSGPRSPSATPAPPASTRPSGTSRPWSATTARPGRATRRPLPAANPAGLPGWSRSSAASTTAGVTGTRPRATSRPPWTPSGSRAAPPGGPACSRSGARRHAAGAGPGGPSTWPGGPSTWPGGPPTPGPWRRRTTHSGCCGRAWATGTPPAGTSRRAWPWPRPFPTRAPGWPPPTTSPSPWGGRAGSTRRSSSRRPPSPCAPPRATATARQPSTTTWPTCSTRPAGPKRPGPTCARAWRSSPRSARPTRSSPRSVSWSSGEGVRRLRPAGLECRSALPTRSRSVPAASQHQDDTSGWTRSHPAGTGWTALGRAMRTRTPENLAVRDGDTFTNNLDASLGLRLLW